MCARYVFYLIFFLLLNKPAVAAIIFIVYSILVNPKETLSKFGRILGNIVFIEDYGNWGCYNHCRPKAIGCLLIWFGRPTGGFFSPSVLRTCESLNSLISLYKLYFSIKEK